MRIIVLTVCPPPGPGRCAGGELWEKSGHATGNPGDAYVPGKVHMPQEAGKIVQLSTGREGVPG